jgi:hypothetical protein
LDSINRKLILSEKNEDESPEFKFKGRHDDDYIRETHKRGKNSGGKDSLNELIQNTKFDATGDRDGFIGEGISPDKKRRRSNRPDDRDYETQ